MQTQVKPAPQRLPAGAALIISAVVLLILAIIVNRLNSLGLGNKALEYPIWAVLVGLLANAGFSAAGVKDQLSGAWRTEFFLKIGLVLLGASVNITAVMSVGLRGVAQAVIMVAAVFFFTWWLAGLFKLDDKLRAVMSSAVAICGVSAAIAAAGAVVAKREQIAYVTTLVILTALPLMVLMPWFATTIGMSSQWAGAWFGGNIDTTAAVVGAGTLFGEEAAQVASIVKLAQNALMGVAAFLLASYWALVKERNPQEKPSARLIWDRFPKFVLGFILVSILASLSLFSKEQISALNNLRNWAFTFAFIGIGLDLSVTELRKAGGKPIVVYVIATVFNTVLAFGVSWLFFGMG
jgi:uncharacterized integral membrane protein (TIGR00698 family)